LIELEENLTIVSSLFVKQHKIGTNANLFNSKFELTFNVRQNFYSIEYFYKLCGEFDWELTNWFIEWSDIWSITCDSQWNHFKTGAEGKIMRFWFHQSLDNYRRASLRNKLEFSSKNSYHRLAVLLINTLHYTMTKTLEMLNFAIIEFFFLSSYFIVNANGLLIRFYFKFHVLLSYDYWLYVDIRHLLFVPLKSPRNIKIFLIFC